VPASDEGVTVAGKAHLSQRLIGDLGQHRFPRRVSALKPA
jgi:hypothetical protein